MTTLNLSANDSANRSEAQVDLQYLLSQ